MGLFGGKEAASEEVERLVENAVDDSVTAEVLSKKKASGLTTSNYLNDAPLIEYLTEGEQPHFVFAYTMPFGVEVSVEGGEDLKSDRRLRTLFVLSDERIVFLVGKSEGDQVVEVPYDSITHLELDETSPDGTSQDKFELRIETAERSYTVELLSIGYDVEQVRDAGRYVAERTE